MNKTRFQLPPRVNNGTGVDHWLTEKAETASAWADAEMAPPPNNATDMFWPAKVPFLFDVAALLTAQRRNFEALTEAHRIAWVGAESVVRRNLEMMQQTMTGVSESVRPLSGVECPGERAVRQTETIIRTYENALAHVKELQEMVQQTGAEVMEVLNKRLAEAVDEVESLARSAALGPWNSGWKPAMSWQQT